MNFNACGCSQMEPVEVSDYEQRIVETSQTTVGEMWKSEPIGITSK